MRKPTASGIAFAAAGAATVAALFFLRLRGIPVLVGQGVSEPASEESVAAVVSGDLR